MKRLNGVDFFRLVAALQVVSLHVGFYEELPTGFGEFIRAAARWCVPFFFLTSGYFLYRKDSEYPEVSFNQVVRVLRIFCIASLLYLPLYVLSERASLKDAFDSGILVNGTHFHLWFLGSMALGLLIVKMLRSAALLLATSTVILVAFFAVDASFAADPLRFGDEEELLRILLSVPFLWFGFLMHKHQASLPGAFAGVALILTGYVLSVLEGYALEAHGVNFVERQIFVGVVLTAVGAMLLALSLSELPHWLGEMGRRWATSVYIIHPIFIVVAHKVFNTSQSSSTFIVALVLTMLSVTVLGRYTPTALQMLEGRFPEVRHGTTTRGERMSPRVSLAPE